jgi:uncharacterized membrane protein
MTKTRLEAFSDAVIAIIMTIMVLELKVPHGASFSDLESLWPVFVSYLISCILIITVAVMWLIPDRNIEKKIDQETISPSRS